MGAEKKGGPENRRLLRRGVPHANLRLRLHPGGISTGADLHDWFASARHALAAGDDDEYEDKKNDPRDNSDRRGTYHLIWSHHRNVLLCSGLIHYYGNSDQNFSGYRFSI